MQLEYPDAGYRDQKASETKVILLYSYEIQKVLESHNYHIPSSLYD